MKKKQLKRIIENADVVINEFKELCNGFEQTITNLQSENSALKKELKNNTSAQAYSVLNGVLENAKQSIKDLKIDKKNMFVNYLKLENKFFDLQAENEVVNKHLLSSSSKNIDNLLLIENLQKEVNSLKTKSNTINSNELFNVTDLINLITETINAFTLDVKNLQTENEQLKKALSLGDSKGNLAQEKEIELWKTNVTRLTNINKDIDKRNSELDLENRQFVNQICELGIKNKGLQKDLHELNESLEQKDAVISHLQSKYDAVCKRLAGYERNIEIADCDFLQSEISDLESKIFELTKENERLQKEINGLNEMIDLKESTISKLINKINGLESEIETFKCSPYYNEHVLYLQNDKSLIKFNQFLYSELSHYKDICEKLAKKEIGIVNLETDNTTQIKDE